MKAITIFLLITIIFLGFSQKLISQTNAIDSLEQLLQQKKTLTKEEKVTICYQLAAQYLYVNPLKTEFYVRKGLSELAENDYEKRGMMYNLLATSNAEKSNFDLALLGLDTALYYYNKANDKESVADIYSNIGGVYTYKYEYKKAASYLYKSLELYDELLMPLEKSAVLNNLISVNIYLKDYEEGLENALKAIKIYESQNDLIGLARTKFNVGIIKLYVHQYEDALVIFDEITPFFIEVELYEMAVLSSIKKSWVLKEMKQTKLALESLEVALELKQYLNSKSTLIELYNSQASLLFDLGLHPKSIQFYEMALDSAKAIANNYYQKEALHGWIKNLEKTGNFKEAYYLTLQAKTLEDTIIHQNNQEQIKELQIKYETEKTAHENIVLGQERDFQTLKATRNKQLLYVSLGAILLILLLAFLLLRQYKTNAANLTSQLKYQLLRNQMNPHFLFNALGAIQSFVYENKPLQAGDYLASFATLMRAILDNSSQEYIALSKELEWLENYLSLQLLRFDNSFEYEISIDENILLEQTFIPPMLVQPFVENALEHGLKNMEHGGKININLHLVHGQLQIEVQDNGVGFELDKKTTKKDHISHAMNITKERLAFLNKKLKNKIYFDLQSVLQKGTSVTFLIPFESQQPTKI